MFKKFVDVEALHKSDVEGIRHGQCWIFPKIDGTNASIWATFGSDGMKLNFGSRTRELTDQADNRNFRAKYLNDERFRKFFMNHPSLRLFGEYLVPHTLRTYREDAWNKFYVFDVYDNETQRYISYDKYSSVLKAYDIEFIPLIVAVDDPTVEELEEILKASDYLIKPEGGYSEGIVIKRYYWVNQFGHYIYGKLVQPKFKDMHRAKKRQPREPGQIEIDIAEQYVTEGRIDKILAKMDMTPDPHVSSHDRDPKLIPQLLNRVYHEIITEEMWEIVKDHKSKFVLDFMHLRKCITNQVKVIKKELF